MGQTVFRWSVVERVLRAMKLAGLQRLACLAITGTMRTQHHRGSTEPSAMHNEGNRKMDKVEQTRIRKRSHEDCQPYASGYLNPKRKIERPL